MARKGRGEFKKLIRELERQGFTVVSGSKHYSVRDSEGNHLYALPNTPSDWRSFQNQVSDLRRTIGFDPAALKNYTAKTVYESPWTEKVLPNLARQARVFLDSQSRDIEEFAAAEADKNSTAHGIAAAHRGKVEEAMSTIAKLMDDLDDDLSRTEHEGFRKEAYRKLTAIADKLAEAGRIFRRNSRYELTGELVQDTGRYVETLAQKIRSETT